MTSPEPSTKPDPATVIMILVPTPSHPIGMVKSTIGVSTSSAAGSGIDPTFCRRSPSGGISTQGALRYRFFLMVWQTISSPPRRMICSQSRHSWSKQWLKALGAVQIRFWSERQDSTSGIGPLWINLVRAVREAYALSCPRWSLEQLAFFTLLALFAGFA